MAAGAERETALRDELAALQEAKAAVEAAKSEVEARAGDLEVIFFFFWFLCRCQSKLGGCGVPDLVVYPSLLIIRIPRLFMSQERMLELAINLASAQQETDDIKKLLALFAGIKRGAHVRSESGSANGGGGGVSGLG